MDPLGFDAGDANLYRYVGNEVTNRLDPSGLDDFFPTTLTIFDLPFPTVGAIGATVGTWLHPPVPVTQALENISAAKPAVEAIINGASLPKDCPKEKVREAVCELMDIASFSWNHSTGLFGECVDWVAEFQKRARTLIERFVKEGLIPHCLRVGQIAWDNSIIGAFGAGHTAVWIQLDDGTNIYLDDGHLGGADHVFVDSELPWFYSGVNSSTWWDSKN